MHQPPSNKPQFQSAEHLSNAPLRVLRLTPLNSKHIAKGGLEKEYGRWNRVEKGPLFRISQHATHSGPHGTGEIRLQSSQVES